MGKKCKDGKAKQQVYDAIRKARSEGEGWCTIQGYRCRLTPVSGMETHARVLVTTKYGVKLGEVSTKDSYMYFGRYDERDPRITFPFCGNTFRIQPKQIVAIVSEMHTR